jgi:SAM-dependent methyltransferase
MTSSKEIAKQLFNCSPLKQRKLKMLEAMMDNPESKCCLDLGSDNGVISLLLRAKGGEWSSADLSSDTVAAITDLVVERVVQVTETSLPFKDQYFDQVLIVDMLEHIEADHIFISEIKRILKPQGILVVNVPNPKEGLLRKIRFMLGQTDAAHGHLRPGYTKEQLTGLLGSGFVIERAESYARLFSEFIDTFIVAALDLLKGGSRGKKGKVVTAADLTKMKKSFKIYQVISPILRIFMFFDTLVPFMHGNMLIIKARKL